MTQKEYARQHYLKNKSRYISRARKWEKDNPMRSKESKKRAHRKYCKLNPVKRRETLLSWRLRNLEKLKSYQIKNRAIIAERVRKLRASNPEYKINQREWRVKNAERCRQAVRNYRSRKRNAPGFCSMEKWLGRVCVWGWLCFYCKKKLSPKTLTQDHRIPLNNGGTNWPSNLVPACGKCNSGKQDRVFYKPPSP